ncbi:hypothetical protein [Thalassotalea aquiviva]|uniref:hypothetical protein n=1 Tax=Thalassotalea aquiviva TaxID=3242415 RepID=UPI00352B82C5
MKLLVTVLIVFLAGCSTTDDYSWAGLTESDIEAKRNGVVIVTSEAGPTSTCLKNKHVYSIYGTSAVQDTNASNQC